MQIQLSHLVIILQTYNQEQVVEITDTDEATPQTLLQVGFNNESVPYKDLVNKLRTLQQHT
jgi:hypothetical protein